MSSTDKGRFCTSCYKNVVDFTNVPDKEIIKALKQENHLCGRFLSTQLNRDLVERKEKKSFWIAASTTILSFLSIGNSEILAQEKPKTEQTDKKVILTENTETNSVNQEMTITGIVTEGKLPLPGAMVVIKGTNRGTQTDMEGKFSIKAKVNEILFISFIGMKDIEHKIQNKNELFIEIEAEYFTMGEIVVEKRTFIGRKLRKIGNWFR